MSGLPATRICIALQAAAMALLAASPARTAQPALPACLAGSPVPIIVRIGEATPRHALLRGGMSPPLEVIDADTAQGMWSASASPPAHQRFDAMHSPFAGSLLPLDLDGDGIHDRIYAGDLAGRLWRFDLHHGQPAHLWASGGVFADLSSGALRGFMAPPDVSLSAGTSVEAGWFNIALGTARLGPAPVTNRFYVLRDRYPFELWPQQRYQQWRALRESDLVRLTQPGASLAGPAPNGYYIETGASDFLSPSITVSGRATLALADPSPHPGTDCTIAAVVSSVDLTTGTRSGILPADGGATAPIAVSMSAGDSFRLLRTGSRAECLLGQTHIPSCDVDLSPRRTWWRREDAD